MVMMKRVDVDRMSIKQFNDICNDFHGVNINDIDYIGFIHTLLYTYIENSIFDEFCNRETVEVPQSMLIGTDELYSSLVDFC